MSFFSISDPIERERVVRDYERIKREIRERNENRKMMGQNQNRLLQETFHPVVKAQTDMAEKIGNVDGNPYIGSAPINIQNDNIIIYNEVYQGRPALWGLITEKN